MADITKEKHGASMINKFLLDNNILIKNNPAISPDLTLDVGRLVSEVREDMGVLASISDRASAEKNASLLNLIIVWPKSFFTIRENYFYVVESKETGDCGLVTRSPEAKRFDGVEKVEGDLNVVPLLWQNLITLKNLVLENAPSSTIFPKAEGSLKTTSLGIGARFTTLHWPAVAWAMKALNLAVTANQNSIPRELVYDVDAMLEGRLSKVPFPFIGSSVPEGHQGQSVQGMSHAAIITYVKLGFHQNNIPWGFNADHQPIGGRFTAIEQELVDGSLFASYITYDMSPELASCAMLDGSELDAAFAASVDPALFKIIVDRLKAANVDIAERDVKKLVTYLMPAMTKVKIRDTHYTVVRQKNFTTDEGRRFFKELSIDELPSETTPQTLAVCLAFAEALGMHFDFVAPNIGFQKNIPYADNAGLKIKVDSLFSVAKAFGVSFGFHSGSGKSAQNYQTVGKSTSGCFEVKTSGRYTYEMGVALSQSTDPADKSLWLDWYDFTRRLAVVGAFSDNATQKNFARDFITASLNKDGVSPTGAFDSPSILKKILDNLNPSADHAFWFEYNFLYVLAAHGNIDNLGDHSGAGYAQRSRFYGVSNQARLLFAKRIAGYIIFLAETTGIVNNTTVKNAGKKLEAYNSYEELLDDIGK